MKDIDRHNQTVDIYNQEADQKLAFVEGNVNGCHSPNGLQIAANDNQQLSFEFMNMAEAAVVMRETQKKGVSA